MVQKRSKFDTNFDLIENNFYRTFDPRAVEALNPHLELETWFTEPCFGYGDLVKGLEAKGHVCSFASELIDRPIMREQGYQVTIKDALTLDADDVSNSTHIITNPPWERKILHPMIEHFVTLHPTWLLFEADWANTKQAIPYINGLCKKIVSVGRMKWIENSPHGGLKDISWYLFDATKDAPTQFFTRNHT